MAPRHRRRQVISARIPSLRPRPALPYLKPASGSRMESYSSSGDSNIPRRNENTNARSRFVAYGSQQDDEEDDDTRLSTNGSSQKTPTQRQIEAEERELDREENQLNRTARVLNLYNDRATDHEPLVVNQSTIGEIHAWYSLAFAAMHQDPCSQLVGIWTDAIFPGKGHFSKKNHDGLKGRIACPAPSSWPEGIEYQSHNRMKMKERIPLLVHFFKDRFDPTVREDRRISNNFLRNAAEKQRSRIESRKHGKRSWRILEYMHYIREIEERLILGEQLNEKGYVRLWELKKPVPGAQSKRNFEDDSDEWVDRKRQRQESVQSRSPSPDETTETIVDEGEDNISVYSLPQQEIDFEARALDVGFSIPYDTYNSLGTGMASTDEQAIRPSWPHSQFSFDYTDGLQNQLEIVYKQSPIDYGSLAVMQQWTPLQTINEIPIQIQASWVQGFTGHLASNVALNQYSQPLPVTDYSLSLGQQPFQSPFRPTTIVDSPNMSTCKSNASGDYDRVNMDFSYNTSSMLIDPGPSGQYNPRYNNVAAPIAQSEYVDMNQTFFQPL